MNQSMICWKWDDSSIAEDYLDKARELAQRFHGDTVCIAAHWVRLPFNHPKLLACFRKCADYFHSIGKRLCIEVCIRNEGERFLERYPQERAYLAHMVETVLDENGNADMFLDIEPVYHYWRVSGKRGPEIVLNGWAFNKYSDTCYIPKSCENIRTFTQIVWKSGKSEAEMKKDMCCQLNYGGEIKQDESGITNILQIRAGKANAGKTAVIIVGTPQPIPDLSSKFLMDYYRTMVESAKEAHVDGVFSDEWGYDVILKIEKVNPYDDNNLFLRHLSISEAMSRNYSKRFPEYSLFEDLLHLYYAPQGKEEISVAAINRYIENLRTTMANNDVEMYKIVKEILGKDAFYGIHPTWWGSVDSLNFEIFKNGFYWWEAIRDIAQTDEAVILPIRTALAHKWGSKLWYNMWYSMGTRDIKTYFRETWNNVRYGGRTHYHGFECPNEAVVLELRQEGLLEQIEEMDSRVRLIEDYQKTQPDSRVLVLFGMEAVSNWRLCGRPHPNWAPQNAILDQVLHVAAKLFDTLLFDLVPTTEIVNGSLTFNNGRAVYGNQMYDTVVLLMPESMDKSCYEYLHQLDLKKLLIYGTVSIYNDGTLVSEKDQMLLNSAYVRNPEIPAAKQLALDILSTGVSANRWENGCRFQDGSVIFTGSGEMNVGNLLQIDCDIDGHHVNFSGEDFVFVHFQEHDVKVCTPSCTYFMVDGVPQEVCR